MAAAFEVVLPHGVVRDGERRTDAVLRPPTGADEAFLLETRGGTRAARVTALLTRCVLELGGAAPEPEALRALTVGDREALLLHLRAAAHGQRLACVVDCPACGERLDLDISLEDALVAPYTGAAETHEALLGERAVRFRLPTGGDQEEAALLGDPLAGGEELLRRCVLAVDGAPAGEVPAEIAEALSLLLAELDPQAEALVALRCPECGAEVQALLDAATILFGELAGSNERLFLEVHALALHYHWSERDILGLELPRRRRYLELLADGEGALA